jgi:LysM repeat protein
MTMNIKDIRAEMPNYDTYKNWSRKGDILGVALHHSATANRVSGAPIGNAASFFDYHVNTLGWAHGGYNYVITGTGEIEYALDERIAAYHAGFKDLDNSDGLEYGQYWNNHYLAICMAGWFSNNRTYRDDSGQSRTIPNNFTSPTEEQMEALIALLKYLREKYNIPLDNIRAHRELAGNSTVCPGLNFSSAAVRETLRQAEVTEPGPPVDKQPEVGPGEHVLLLPDTDRYLDAAMAYVWAFQPDVSFAVAEAVGRWKYVTVVGDESAISSAQLARIRSGGARLVQRIPGNPTQAQDTLDDLVARQLRFLESDEPEPDPEPEFQTYTIQPGDSLSRIALRFYGKSSLWNVIFEANQHILSSPSLIRPGQELKIPPKPE